VTALLFVPVYGDPGKARVSSVIDTEGVGELEPWNVTSGISLVKNTKLSPAPIDI
jgi:hypothetical protein